ncbi:MAG: phosphoribosylformylglycinamidine cyclo-ligase [Nitrososphaerota archaeon]
MAGVDREVLGAIHKTALSHVSRSIGRDPGEFGDFAFLIKIGGTALALHADGVGTKALLASRPEDYRCIGVDAVAMNVNDLVCVGARPVAFLDYIAMSRPDPDAVSAVLEGISEGCRESGARLVGGETAVMPDVFSDERTVDVVGFAAGTPVSPAFRRRVKEGDVLVGLESSGLHANGFSLVRKVLLGGDARRADEVASSLGRTLRDELMRPTRIYVRPVLRLLIRGPRPTGMAHVTGGGFLKLRRLVAGKRLRVNVDSLPEPPKIFRVIQEEGKIEWSEMCRTFNMGVGMVLAFREVDVDEALKKLRGMGYGTAVIGSVERGEGVIVSGVRIDR